MSEGDHSSSAPPETEIRCLRWRRNVAFIVFGAGAAYFLLTEHLAHTIQALPWIILLLCPLMHLFMHRGHGGKGSDGSDEAQGGERHGSPQ